MKNVIHAANATAWAIGQLRGEGFYVRKIIWGQAGAALAEQREGEEIRAAIISVETKGLRKTKWMRRVWYQHHV
jgi:hypothetical protein